MGNYVLYLCVSGDPTMAELAILIRRTREAEMGLEKLPSQQGSERKGEMETWIPFSR